MSKSSGENELRASGVERAPSSEQQLEDLWSAVQSHNIPDGAPPEQATQEILPPSIDPSDWPSLSINEVNNADYREMLRCPHDLLHRQDSSPNKVLCPHGMLCRAELELFPVEPDNATVAAAGGCAYTGLLDAQRRTNNNKLACLLRLSSAMKPPAAEAKSRFSRTLLYAAGEKLRKAKLFPCVALKIPRGGGTKSGNLLFGGCKVGQEESDFFAHCVCTQLTERVSRVIKPLIRKFWEYSDYPLSLGVSDFCSHTQDGQKVPVEQVEFPFALILMPVTKLDINETEPGRTFHSYMKDLHSIPSGTHLYDLYACPNPESVSDASKLQRIGRVTTTSEMIPSRRDDGLFFRHQMKEEDYELRPHWKTAVQASCSPDGGKTIGTVAKLAGWELFESQIAKGTYLDLEKDL